MLYTKSLHLDVQPLPFEWKPCFTCAVLELGQATCPSPHQPSRHIKSMNWQLSFDGLQEGLQVYSPNYQEI